MCNQIIEFDLGAHDLQDGIAMIANHGTLLWVQDSTPPIASVAITEPGSLSSRCEQMCEKYCFSFASVTNEPAFERTIIVQMQLIQVASLSA